MAEQRKNYSRGSEGFEIIERFFQENDPLTESLPLEAEHFQLETYWVECVCCADKIEGDLLHGTITEVAEDSYLVRAVGACLECRIYSPHQAHVIGLEDDVRIVALPHDFGARYDDNVVEFPTGAGQPKP